MLPDVESFACLYVQLEGNLLLLYFLRQVLDVALRLASVVLRGGRLEERAVRQRNSRWLWLQSSSHAVLRAKV